MVFTGESSETRKATEPPGGGHISGTPQRTPICTTHDEPLSFEFPLNQPQKCTLKKQASQKSPDSQENPVCRIGALLTMVVVPLNTLCKPPQYPHKTNTHTHTQRHMYQHILPITPNISKRNKLASTRWPLLSPRKKTTSKPHGLSAAKRPKTSEPPPAAQAAGCRPDPPLPVFRGNRRARAQIEPATLAFHPPTPERSGGNEIGTNPSTS